MVPYLYSATRRRSGEPGAEPGHKRRAGLDDTAGRWDIAGIEDSAGLPPAPLGLDDTTETKRSTESVLRCGDGEPPMRLPDAVSRPGPWWTGPREHRGSVTAWYSQGGTRWSAYRPSGRPPHESCSCSLLDHLLSRVPATLGASGGARQRVFRLSHTTRWGPEGRRCGPGRRSRGGGVPACAGRCREACTARRDGQRPGTRPCWHRGQNHVGLLSAALPCGATRTGPPQRKQPRRERS